MLIETMEGEMTLEEICDFIFLCISKARTFYFTEGDMTQGDKWFKYFKYAENEITYLKNTVDEKTLNLIPGWLALQHALQATKEAMGLC